MGFLNYRDGQCYVMLQVSNPGTIKFLLQTRGCYVAKNKFGPHIIFLYVSFCCFTFLFAFVLLRLALVNSWGWNSRQERSCLKKIKLGLVRWLQWVKAPDIEPDSLIFNLWDHHVEITDFCQLSSDLYMCAVARVPTHTLSKIIKRFSDIFPKTRHNSAQTENENFHIVISRD